MDDQQLDDVSSIQSLSSTDPGIPLHSDDQAIEAILSSEANTETEDLAVNEDVILSDVEPNSVTSDSASLSSFENSSEASKSLGDSMDQAIVADTSVGQEFKFDSQIMQTMTQARAMQANSSVTRENQMQEVDVKTAVHLQKIKIKIMEFADQLLRSGVNRKSFDELLSSYLKEVSTSPDVLTAEAVPLYGNFPETWKETKASILRDIFLHFKPILLYSCPDGHGIYALDLESEQECPFSHTPRHKALTFLYCPICYDIQVYHAWFALHVKVNCNLDQICLH